MSNVIDIHIIRTIEDVCQLISYNVKVTVNRLNNNTPYQNTPLILNSFGTKFNSGKHFNKF